MRANWIICILTCVLVATQIGCNRTPIEVGKHKIPVFPGSRLTNTETGGMVVSDLDSGRSTDIAITIWTFKCSAPLNTVVEFYVQRYPQAEQEDYRDHEDGPGYSMVWWPGGPNSEEEVSIEMEEGGFVIADSAED